VLAWKIKRIELAKDPMPVKLSQKEKDKVMSTSRAQSIVSSRQSSRRQTPRLSFDEGTGAAAGQTVDAATGTKCVQTGADHGEAKRDDGTIENDPGMFAAE